MSPRAVLPIPWRRQVPAAIALQFCPQLLIFGLGLANPFSHAEDDVDSREVYAQFVDEALDLAQTVNVCLRIESLPSARPLRLDEADPFVLPQRLRVYADHHRCHRDYEARCEIFIFLRSVVWPRHRNSLP